MTDARRTHWDSVYAERAPEETSWFEATPTTSLRLIEGALDAPGTCIDVGGGRSPLAAALLARGWSQITVLDLSAVALDALRSAIGDDPRVRFVAGDVLTADRARYAEIAAATVGSGGVAVIGCFAPDGPEACSGLPVTRASADELAALLAPAFVLEAAERGVHTTPWGAEQSFTWVVLRRV